MKHDKSGMPERIDHQHLCLRCGAEWQSKKLFPSQCPECHSRKWNEKKPPAYSKLAPIHSLKEMQERAIRRQQVRDQMREIKRVSPTTNTLRRPQGFSDL